MSDLLVIRANCSQKQGIRSKKIVLCFYIPNGSRRYSLGRSFIKSDGSDLLFLQVNRSFASLLTKKSHSLKKPMSEFPTLSWYCVFVKKGMEPTMGLTDDKKGKNVATQSVHIYCTVGFYFDNNIVVDICVFSNKSFANDTLSTSQYSHLFHLAKLS